MSQADRVRAAAKRLETHAKILKRKGLIEGYANLMSEATKLRAIADALEREGLRDGESTGSLQDVTQAQLERRARGIAAGKAAADPRKAAIVTRWGTMGKAAKALRISPQALSAYLSGLYPCPENVARIVEREFGLPPDSRTRLKGTTK